MTTPAASKTLGLRLRYLREQAGLSLREVARRAEVDHARLSRIERGTQALSPPYIAAYETCLDIRIERYRQTLEADSVEFYDVACPTVLERFTIEIQLDSHPTGPKLNGINLIWTARTGSDSFSPKIHMPPNIRDSYSFNSWFPPAGRTEYGDLDDRGGIPLYFTGGDPWSEGFTSRPQIGPYEDFEVGWRGHQRSDSDLFIFGFDWATIAPRVELKLWEVSSPGDAIVSWQGQDLPLSMHPYSRRELGAINRNEWYTLKWRTRPAAEGKEVLRHERALFDRIYEFESKGWVRVAEDIWRNEKGVERKLNDILRRFGQRD